MQNDVQIFFATSLQTRYRHQYADYMYECRYVCVYMTACLSAMLFLCMLNFYTLHCRCLGILNLKLPRRCSHHISTLPSTCPGDAALEHSDSAGCCYSFTFFLLFLRIHLKLINV